jgi:ribosomal protein S18 acetylase RimI-like enzyme
MDPTNDSLRIRDARPDELDDVSKLLRAAYLQYEKSMPADVWQGYLEDITDIRSRLAMAELVVAELDGCLVGSVTLYSNASYASEAGWPRGWAGIRLLAVDPAYRRRGIGGALMDECIRRCRERGIAVLGLHTTEIMDVARRMYERMGFRRVPEYDFHPAPGVVVMAYRLDINVKDALSA